MNEVTRKPNAESAPAVVKTSGYQGADYPCAEETAPAANYLNWVVIGGVLFVVVGGMFVAAGPQIKNFFANAPVEGVGGGPAISCAIYR